MSDQRYDVVIVGGGPAGMNAALLLGRCCRRVLLCDSGRPRNAHSSGVHGFLTRDGVMPADLRRIARAEVARYEAVEIRDVEVTDAVARAGGFEVTLADETRAFGRRMLLATGLVDDLPPIPGVRELWGRGVYPCPYCDAYDYRRRRIGVLGCGPNALALIRALTSWTRDLVLLSNGPTELPPEDCEALVANGVQIARERVLAIDQRQGQLHQIRLDGVDPIRCEALFLSSPQRQRSALVARLGCELNEKQIVVSRLHESTNVPGLFVAGDASDNIQFAIVAAAEGMEAAFEINRSLVREDFERTARRA